MATKETAYSALLKDPRWQKLRLQVMERDLFTCRSCNSSDKTLNIHHKKYVFGKKPWEYEMDQLVTYCEDCHSKISNEIDQIKQLLSDVDADDLQKLKRIIYILKYHIQSDSLNRTLIYLATNLSVEFGGINTWKPMETDNGDFLYNKVISEISEEIGKSYKSMALYCELMRNESK